MKLFFHKKGDQSPLIILHGLFGSSDNWRTLGNKFAKFYTVYTLDMRNHGRSPHRNTMSYAEMATDVAEFMQQASISSATILGHSMGGKVAMQMAADYRERVDALLIVDTAPVTYVPDHNVIINALLSINIDQVKSRPDVEKLMEKDIPKFAIRQFLMKGLQRNPDGTYRWKYNLKAISQEYNKLILEVRQPSPFNKRTLFVRGAQSKYILDQYVDRIKEDYPNAELVTIPHAGHWVHAEAPDDFYKCIIDFYNSTLA